MMTVGNDQHCFALFRWGLWVRIGGEPLFSERNGLVKVWAVGKLRVKVLRDES